jgi:cytidylate kinase
MKLLITIDGPAGAGKTTVSRMLAQKLAYRYLDSGALYRAIALKALESGLNPESAEEQSAMFQYRLAELCDFLDLRFEDKNGENRLFSEGRDVTGMIRAPEVTMMASKISAFPVVRRALLAIQRAIGSEKGVVAEGRDMGTVVFPDADLKFFLDASVEARARRRCAEMTGKNSQSLAQVREQIERRDADDTSRDLSPLVAAPDAVRIDSTRFSAEQVVDRMMKHVFQLFEK